MILPLFCVISYYNVYILPFHLDPEMSNSKVASYPLRASLNLPEIHHQFTEHGKGSLIFRKPSQNAKPNLNQTRDEPGAPNLFPGIERNPPLEDETMHVCPSIDRPRATYCHKMQSMQISQQNAQTRAAEPSSAVNCVSACHKHANPSSVIETWVTHIIPYADATRPSGALSRVQGVH